MATDKGYDTLLASSGGFDPFSFAPSNAVKTAMKGMTLAKDNDAAWKNSTGKSISESKQKSATANTVWGIKAGGNGVWATTNNPPGDNSTSNGNPYGYGYGYGYGGGYGGGGSASPDPTDMQKEVAKNLQPIVDWNRQTAENKFKLGDKMYDTADEQSGNLRAVQLAQAAQAATDEWYRQQQKSQSVVSLLRDTMQNAAYGSGFMDLNDMVARHDDQTDDDTLQAYRQNTNNIDVNYWESIMGNIDSRNKLAADTETSIRDLVSDAAAQINNINPMLANGLYQEGYEGLGDDQKKGDVPDDADEYWTLIDREGKKLKAPPGWNTDFASGNWTAALKPELAAPIRDNLSAQKTSATGYRNYNPNLSGAAVRDNKGIQSYIPGYTNRRTQ